MSRKKDSEEKFSCIGTSTLGERGQLVVPAEIRKKLDVKKGDKFIIFLSPHEKEAILAPSKNFEKIISKMDKKLAQLKRLTK